MHKEEAHAAEKRNFIKTLRRATEECAWHLKSFGGDGRLADAIEMWYAANPDKDVRKELEYEPDECTDPTCGPCADPNWYDGY